ncbi:myb-like protein X [Euwallacea fornicatus]|uniref:myb-like protein X n=1 Tax=Euwallacea fornicatus TaxID=995702 RepID=UPI00338DB232
MSINVTVTGNPVSIKRGKMVTSGDPQEAKKEFDKRRLLRLEQVRQQSKEQAEKVRKKVQREKKRQLGQIEKEGKEQLKNWQNRKLLELHNQYLDALDEIGIGHKEAEKYADESEILENQKLKNEEITKARGKSAGTKLQVQKNEQNFKQAVPLQHKKLVRDIENTRAAMVCSMKRKSPKKHGLSKIKKNKPSSADINISIPEDSDFCEASNSDSSKHLPNIQEETTDNDSEGFCECSSDSSEVPPKEVEKTYQDAAEERKRLIEDFRNKPKLVAENTRISDRIKQRRFMAAEPDFCDLLDDPMPQVFEGSKFAKADSAFVIKAPKDALELSSEDCICTKRHTKCPCMDNMVKSAAVQTDVTEKKSCKCEFKSLTKNDSCIINKELRQQQNIPVKPPVMLKETKIMTRKVCGGEEKVRHYDYQNRFTSDKPSISQVGRIDSESIEVMPNISSERERIEKMKQRDREAVERGNKALERERVRRDYEELMKQLPMLQRKEHISRIGNDRPEYHMSDERLKERAQERQNRLENAYLQAIPDLKPRIVTIPRRKPEDIESNEPFKIIDRDDPRSLKLGKWDTDFPPKTMFSAEEVQEIIKAFTVQKPEDSKEKLKQLLKSLKLQKEQLINEIKALPKDDSIDALLGDLPSFSDNREEEKPKKGKENKRRRVEDNNSSNTSEDSQKNKEKQTKMPKHKKARKSRSKVLVLQNTSTQTTPKSTKEQSSSTLLKSEAPKKEFKDVKICTRTHVPCDCDTRPSSEEICKILIKLGEENKGAKVEVLPGKEELPPKSESMVQKTLKDKPKKIDETPRNIENVTEKKPFKIYEKENSVPSEKKKHIGKSTTSKSCEASWKEQLSKNSTATSSTSYYSPPDYTKPGTSETSSSLYNLRKKTQQTNIPNDQLLNYIKRLLTMSKNTIDDLGASSSDVQTPSQSVIEMETNHPLAAVENVLKQVNDLTLEGTIAPLNSSTETSGKSNVGTTPEAEKITTELLSQYANVTDSCIKRIANLAAMIEQLRREKIQMIASPPLISPIFSDDKDNSSTKYFEFPPTGDKLKETSSTASMDEEELNKRLLEIDMSLAEKLREFRQVQAQSEAEEEQLDQQFVDRLQRLIHQQEPQKDLQPGKPFVQFLVDIPKLPILEPEPEGYNDAKRRPPPSKGLITAKKFNGNISLMPHELSTIAEADSQLSNKVSPNTSKLNMKEAVAEASLQSDSSKSLTCIESTCTNIGTSILTSSSSGSDMKSIETMLKSIGMEWAIPTLHKTQEALALTSSSSDLSLKEKKSSRTSASELSLKEFLKKKLENKISSSSLNKSEASSGSFVRDCSELSAIQVTSSAEKTKQRTSTPVISSKSTMNQSKEEQQQLFTGASDISSVRSTSGEQSKQTFRSLGEELSKSSPSD